MCTCAEFKGSIVRVFPSHGRRSTTRIKPSNKKASQQLGDNFNCLISTLNLQCGESSLPLNIDNIEYLYMSGSGFSIPLFSFSFFEFWFDTKLLKFDGTRWQAIFSA